MKYKVGDKTVLGEIIEIDKLSTNPYVVKVEEWRHWFTESEIDAIICKPKRNIDHLIELWDGGEADKACRFMYDNIEWNKRALYDVMFELFKPYIEPRKYPILTPEELKAVKWLVEGGFNTIRNYNTWVETSHSDDLWLDVKILPTAHCLESSAWITETPIDLKELLEAQEGV